jgi:prolyl oligopeptidase
MKKPYSTYLIFLLALIMTKVSHAQYHYPEIQTVDSVDTYFGVKYKDPYRRLEDLKDSQVLTWYKQEADFTDSILNRISGRDELVRDVKILDKLEQPWFYTFKYENGRVFYIKQDPGDDVGKLYYRNGIKGQDELLFDPQTYIKDSTLSVSDFLPSHDGNKVVIAYTEKGKEIAILKVMDVNSKKYFPETINSSYTAFSWTFDDSAFLYNSLNSSDNTDAQFKLNPKTKLHKLGTPVYNDIDFFSDSSYPNMDIKPSEFTEASVNEDSKNYIFASVSSTRNENIIYYAPISQFNSGNIQWKPLCKLEDKIVKDILILGNDVYGISYDNAKNYKLVHTTLANPNWKQADVIAKNRTDLVLEEITHSKNYLFLIYTDGINKHIFKYSLITGKTLSVNLPFSGTVRMHCWNDSTNFCRVNIQSWNKPFMEFEFEAETDKFYPSIFNKTSDYPDSLKNIVVEEIEVKGRDGTMIPLSIIYKKGMKKDGSHTCLLEGYGAYGYSYIPQFDYFKLLAAAKGTVRAIAHIRGGGEKGDDWYKGGYKATKPNSWRDFNDCAQFLVDSGYTSSKRLACLGRSAGGIVISRAITERPDLYGAAICEVGVANAMRNEFSPNGPANIPEFGTVKDSIECRGLFEMDGVQHVVKDVSYPAVICSGGLNDPRVLIWEPAKFAAALQNNSSSNKPVLLKVNYNSGHGIDNLSIAFLNAANLFAFAYWQCGDKNYQLK